MTEAYDIRQAIACSHWFKGAPDDCLDKLTAAASVRHYDASSFLWTMGQETTEVYGLLSGRVRLSLSSAMGQEFALADWEQGAWLGEQGLGIKAPNVLVVQVLVPTDVVAIPHQVVAEVGEAWPRLYRRLFRTSWINTFGLYELLAGLMFYPLRARLARRLLVLAEEHGTLVDDGVLLDIKLSQNDFARLATGSRQRVNKIFRDWDRLGTVKSRRDQLLIRSISELEKEVLPFD